MKLTRSLRQHVVMIKMTGTFTEKIEGSTLTLHSLHAFYLHQARPKSGPCPVMAH